MVISVDAKKKAFDEVEHLFMIKTIQKVGTEGTCLNIIRAIYNKPTANNILKGEKLKAFPLRTETGHDVHSHHFLFNIVCNP